MKHKRFVLTFASLTAGFGLGILISFLVFPSNQSDVKASPSRGIQPVPAASSDATNRLANEERQLEDIVEIATATERRQALYRLTAKKSGEQIAELVRQSYELEHSKNLYSVQRILIAELTHIEPEKSLEVVWEGARNGWETLLNIVATHWSASDPEGALRALSSIDEPWKSRAINTVVKNQTSLTSEKLVEIAESLEISEHLVMWSVVNDLEEVINEPQAAFKFVLEADIPDFEKQSLLTRITRRWIERESTDNISAMLSLVNEVFADAAYFLRVPIVKGIVAKDPQLAWEQLLSLSPEIQKRFNGIVFEEWSKQDPLSAIQALTTQEYMDSMKVEVGYMLAGWVRTVSDRFLEHIELIPEDYKISSIDTVVEHLAESKPAQDVLVLLSQLEDRGFNTDEATTTFVRLWSQREPEAAVRWAIQNLDLQTFWGQWPLRRAIQQLALSDPEKAMETALEQPAEIALEQEVVLSLLRQGEIEKGLSLFTQMRASSDYPIPFRSISYILIEAGRIDDMLALTEQVEESEKPNFYRSMARPWVRFELESLLEYLPKLPTSEMQQIVAANVLREQEYYPYLTAEELEFVRTFVPDESD